MQLLSLLANWRCSAGRSRLLTFVYCLILFQAKLQSILLIILAEKDPIVVYVTVASHIECQSQQVPEAISDYGSLERPLYDSIVIDCDKSSGQVIEVDN